MTTDREWIRLLHGELGEAHAARLRQKMMDDPRLAARFAALERTWAALALPPAPPAPAELRSRILDAVSQQRPPVAPRWMGAAVAAALALGMALGFGYGRLGDAAKAVEEDLGRVEIGSSLAEAWLAAWIPGEADAGGDGS